MKEYNLNIKYLFWVFIIIFFTSTFIGCSAKRNLVITENDMVYLEKVKKLPNKFIINENQYKIVHSRCQIFIEKYSRLKLKVVKKDYIATRRLKEYIISTSFSQSGSLEVHSATEPGNGYRISFNDMDNNKIQIKVSCFGRNGTRKDRKLNEKVLVYYLFTGKIRPKFITR